MAKIYIHVEELQYSLQFGNIDLKKILDGRTTLGFKNPRISQRTKVSRFMPAIKP
jgi:hypothetical protein